MKIAIMGPATVPSLRRWLDVGADEPLPAGHGGALTTVVCRELLRQGHELVLCTLDPSTTATVTFTGPQLTVHVCPLRSGQRGRDAYRQERRALAAAIVGERTDVTHAWWTYEYALAAQAARRTPLLITAQDWSPVILRFQTDIYRVVRMGMQAAVLARARHLTVPSPYLARLLAWRRIPIEVIPNPVADDAFAPVPDTPRPRTGRLLTVADGFSRRKNTATLLRAFAQLYADDPSLSLLLVGAGHDAGGEAAQWAAARGLDRGVDFRGSMGHAAVLTLMGEIDALVHPALEETFGMILAEAAAQVTPVIAGRASGAVPWVLAGGDAGRLVDVRDPVALAAGIRDLLSDREAAHALAVAGRAWAWSRFRASVVTQRYVETYTRLGGRRAV